MKWVKGWKIACACFCVLFVILGIRAWFLQHQSEAHVAINQPYHWVIAFQFMTQAVTLEIVEKKMDIDDE